MPESYEVALFLHIVSVVLLAGAIMATALLLALMRRADDVRDVRQISRIARLADVLSPAAIIVIVLTGVWMVEDLEFDWGSGWINVSMLTIIIMGVVWPLVITRKMSAIADAADDQAQGAPSQVLAAQLADPILFGTVHASLTAILAIIWNMTTKPGDAQAGVVVLLAIVIGAGSAFPMVARQQDILEQRPGDDATR